MAIWGPLQEGMLRGVQTPCPESSNPTAAILKVDGHVSGGNAPMLFALGIQMVEWWSGTNQMGNFSPKIVAFGATLSGIWTGPAVALVCQPDVPIWTGSVQAA